MLAFLCMYTLRVLLVILAPCHSFVTPALIAKVNFAFTFLPLINSRASPLAERKDCFGLCARKGARASASTLDPVVDSEIGQPRVLYILTLFLNFPI